MWDSREIKKTRKVHKCLFCYCQIPVGSHCNYEVGVYEGDFQYYHLCDRCVAYMSLYGYDFEDDPGNLWDSLSESNRLDCPSCGSFRNRKIVRNDEEQTLEVTYICCREKRTIDVSIDAFKKGGPHDN